MLQTTDSGTKFCQHCGKEIMREAVVCPNCGCAVDGESRKNAGEKPEGVGLLNCTWVFALLMPIVGLILGIIGGCVYKTKPLRIASLIAIPVSILMIFVWDLFFAAIGYPFL